MDVHEVGHGFSYYRYHHNAHHHGMFLPVDDTDLVQSACDVNDSGEAVAIQNANAGRPMEGGLRATGGAALVTVPLVPYRLQMAASEVL
jgi:hypothetical protein